MSNKVLAGFAMTAAFGLLLSGYSSGQDPVVVGERNLTIAYVSDEMGRLEPCG
jgi:hypothetical protein